MGKLFNTHQHALGDICSYSDTVVGQGYGGDRCPAGCLESRVRCAASELSIGDVVDLPATQAAGVPLPADVLLFEFARVVEEPQVVGGEIQVVTDAGVLNVGRQFTFELAAAELAGAAR